MQLLLPGDPEIPVLLRRSPRARRMSLRVAGIDGRVTLSVPAHVDEAAARAFLESRAVWLRGHVAAVPREIPVRTGVELPVLGVPRRIVSGLRRHVELAPSEVAVPGPAAQVPARLRGYLRETARAHLAASVGSHAEALGVRAGALTLRDVRSRWGSCTSEGRLMFSWRLVLAPPAILDYVAAHEVAHLREMNHGPRFWALVAELCPDHATARRWLRREGATLHRYRFDGA